MTALTTEAGPTSAAQSVMAGRRVLVTGAAGFLGTHLTSALAAAGAEVVGLDLRPPPANSRSVAHWLRADLLATDPADLAAVKADTVIHLAALVGVAATTADSETTRTVILDGTERVLAAARMSGCPPVVYVSSSEVYGQAGTLPITEDTEVTPLSTYGAAKALAELAVRDYATETGGCALVVRPFNVYGPGQRTDFVVPRFVAAALRGQPLTVTGDGLQLRTFTYVDDFIDGLLAAVARSAATPAATSRPDVYNLAGWDTTTAEALAALIIDELGSASRVTIGIPPRQLGRADETEVRHRVASSHRARTDLGFVPKISLRAGVRRLAEYLSRPEPRG